MHENEASSFASALDDLAMTEGKRAEYQTALREIRHLFLVSPELVNTLESYAIPKERLYSLCDSLWGKSGLKSLSPFMKTLVKNHAISYFDEIEKAFSSLVNESLGIEEGLLYSAKSLSPAEHQAIEEAVGKALKKKVSLVERLEPSLIGGIKVAVAGKVYDGSLERKLAELRRSLLVGGHEQ